MPIKRTPYLNEFSLDNIPAWICPSCQRGVLTNDLKEVKTHEKASSRAAHNHEAWEPEWMVGCFSGVLSCSNSTCKEKIGILGHYRCIRHDYYDEVTGEPEMDIFEILTPTTFNPPIHIFHVNDEVPEAIRIEIISAFNLYWMDTASCANKIRVVVEKIMDSLKVVKTYKSPNKRKSYSLHQRIEFFKTNFPQYADSLMAIKWIGNSGSHNNDSLNKNDILDAFEILEYVLGNIYETHTTRINKLTKTINKRKKPVGLGLSRKPPF
ncbi:DUF4145 domain-containing protein [Dyadobacter sp. CY345]|uniref:DUF4145 domain-containing protein n=1 Tax=Dyadobacter sp. CY345 TaxID=2909335 RepID=UPI001F2BA79C|nr:DUF4145 domain-containing protein [Dyadobacter sp. CY345]MCF2447621.1 DUF4145 domain-containing protein [Dyadobacter sp. CY345]